MTATTRGLARAYTCPTTTHTTEGLLHTILGCGSTFSAEPDDEGLIDCPECGIWFNPVKEPALEDPNPPL